MTSAVNNGTPAESHLIEMTAARSDPRRGGIPVKAAKPVCAIAVDVAGVVSNTTYDLKF